jgi:hypothetical protein
VKRASTLIAVAIALSALGPLAGCVGDPKVVRVYDGRIVEGTYIPPEAYAAYLRGALADEAGDLKGAASFYEQAVREDDEDAETWTRLGDVRCRLDPKSNSADEAFDKAKKIDGAYASLLAARSRCAVARGKQADALQYARAAVEADATNAEMEALHVSVLAKQGGERAPGRERAIALTLASGERPAAWEALAAWGRAKGDADLIARGLEGLVRTAPMRLREVEEGALELLGLGFAAHARRVAASITDAPRDRLVVGPRDETVARLAVDEALLRGDQAAAERRATRGHVSLPEVAARAMLLERRDLADALARAVATADPSASCAHMVLAALAPHGKRPTLGRPNDEPPAACALALVDRIAVVAGGEVGRAWLSRVGFAKMSPHDPLVGPLAVDLAARGVVRGEDLPIEQRIELAARRREAPPAIEASQRAAVDAKHTFLWHALVDPRSGESRAMLAHLGSAADRDPIVGFAVARIAFAEKADVLEPARRAIAAAPAHPLMLAAAVELAKRAGRGEDLAPARTRLMAVARTPAERALATE